MAYTAGELICTFSAGPGRSTYLHNSDDNVNTIEAGGYFNNTDDNLNLGPGDLIHCIIWNGTPFAAGQIPNGYSLQVVTTVDPAGVVNTAEAGISTAGAISSGA